MRVNLIKPKYVLGGAMLCAALMGCASTHAPARNVREATSIMAIGGVPGAGVIALSAQALEIFSKTQYIYSKSLEPYFSQYAKEKKLVYFTRFINARKDRFAKGDWGDDEATSMKNIADYEAGKKIGVVYSSKDSYGFEIVFSYIKNAEQVTLMTTQEWLAESTK